LKRALTISRQIDNLGAMPTVQAKPVKVSDKAKEILRFDLDNEADTIRNYRERVRQCEAMGEFSIAEHIREILLGEQDQFIDLATALGEEAPDLQTGGLNEQEGKSTTKESNFRCISAMTGQSGNFSDSIYCDFCRSSGTPTR
jgi:bacterioferritin (cytochrome b1)